MHGIAVTSTRLWTATRDLTKRSSFPAMTLPAAGKKFWIATEKKYSDRAEMGTLTFSNLEITPLSNDSAVALGSWKLNRANDQPHGRFTLIFRRLPEGWRIVHDHTSAASEK